MPSACLRACVHACVRMYVCLGVSRVCACVLVRVRVCAHDVKYLLSLVCLICFLLCSITTTILFGIIFLVTFVHVCIEGFFSAFYLQTALNINQTSESFLRWGCFLSDYQFPSVFLFQLISGMGYSIKSKLQIFSCIILIFKVLLMLLLFM